MGSKLLTENVWSEIRAAVKKHKGPSQVAVSYFGQGGADLLPLKKGSKLVVDLSDKTVKSGGTDPRELIKLQKRGVEIYHHGALHAKVMVVGKRAFIGSANVSQNSAENLVEAVISVSDPSLVKSATIFIDSLAITPYGPEILRQSALIYRPASDKKRKSGKKAANPLYAGLQNFFVYLLEDNYEPTAKQETLRKRGKAVIRRRQYKASSGNKIQELYWHENIKCQPKDTIFGVTEYKNRTTVMPPGVVVHVERERNGSESVLFIEVPKKPEINIEKWPRMKEKLLFEEDGRISKEDGWRLVNSWKDMQR